MEQLLCQLLNLYVIAIFLRIVLSWFPISPDSPFASVFSFLYTITEPVLGPVRRLMPPMGMGGMGIDFSPIIVFIGIRIFSAAVLGC